MFWFLTYQEEEKGQLRCPTLAKENAKKICFIPLQSP